ncbi:MAG: NAD(P)H-hydrate dehydratase [Opitutaceae bacterium]|nr:NAD(P)H-hydrate dehydratase [Opitutaceae bacterium]
MDLFAHPILDSEQAKELEKRLFAGDEEKEWQAMAGAGAAIARAALRDFNEVGQFPGQARIGVLAGKGHNGGDALLAAHHILGCHPKCVVEVLFVGTAAQRKPLCMRAWRALLSTGGASVSEVREFAGAYDLLIDGVFGFGYKPRLEGRALDVLEAAGRVRARLRVAVDLPSGLGEGAGFRADFTYATGILKAANLGPGLLPWTGRVRYLDLGFFEEWSASGVSTAVFTSRLLESLRKLRPAFSDKRDYGHLLVLAGSLAYPGAALMAVRAALTAGAGLVTAFVPEPLVAAFAAAVPEAIWIGWPVTHEGGLALEGNHLVRQHGGSGTAWLIGPGIGREREALALAAELVGNTALPVVLDADALQHEIVSVGHTTKVVTPHAGEWERISAKQTPRAFCAWHKAVLVQKGPHTWVHDAFRSCLSPAGGPVLARGGSGDILAGMVAARVAVQGEATISSVGEAVLWHGLAADALARARGPHAVRTTDLLEWLPRALREETHGE